MLSSEEQRERLYCFPTQGPCVAVSPHAEANACAEHLVVQDTHLEKTEVVGRGGGAWNSEVKR